MIVVNWHYFYAIIRYSYISTTAWVGFNAKVNEYSDDYMADKEYTAPDAEEWGRLPLYADFRAMPLPQPDLPVVDAHVYQYSLSEVRDLARLSGFRVEREAFSMGTGGRHVNVVLVPV